MLPVVIGIGGKERERGSRIKLGVMMYTVSIEFTHCA